MFMDLVLSRRVNIAASRTKRQEKLQVKSYFFLKTKKIDMQSKIENELNLPWEVKLNSSLHTSTEYETMQVFFLKKKWDVKV